MTVYHEENTLLKSYFSNKKDNKNEKKEENKEEHKIKKVRKHLMEDLF